MGVDHPLVLEVGGLARLFAVIARAGTVGIAVTGRISACRHRFGGAGCSAGVAAIVILVAAIGVVAARIHARTDIALVGAARRNGGCRGRTVAGPLGAIVAVGADPLVAGV